MNRNHAMANPHSAARPAAKAARKQAVLRTSIGPVEDLESYVKADWWRDIFNANYLRTDGDVVEDPEITGAEVDAYLQMVDVPADTAVLDLCCGQGRHVLELARRGFSNLHGVDRSHYLVSRARKLATQQGHEVRFHEGDARKLRFGDDAFGFVYVAGNSFGYFESAEDDVAVLNEIRRILEPRGRVLIDFTDGEYLRANFEARSWEWIDRNYFVCRERALSRDGSRLVSREVITHVRKGVVADQFYAERLYSEAQLRELLHANGFETDAAQPMATVSKRNQDLGMMAHRIVLAARSTKTRHGARPEAARTQRVAVLMGDHRKPDTVKPGSLFDEDDYHTIDELKKALARVPGYRFSYLDDHDTLVRDLQQQAGRIDLVFNLCDEGLRNEAVKELHVPALLEALDVPYTGGNPQCLAYCYDKSLVRGIASEMDIPVPEAFIVSPEQVTFIALPLAFPVIVKPNFGDSSIGINVGSVCYDVAQLEQAIATAREAAGFDRPVLVEQFLTGKDLSVGIIGNPPDTYRVLPIIEEDYSALPEGLPRICGYEAKWDADSAYFKTLRSIPAELPPATVEFLHASCIRLFQRLGCRDYARFDWRLDANGTPRLLEVNPNPGWCWDGHLARMAELDGLDYADMLGAILAAAVERLSPGAVPGLRLQAA
jgi:D-alanine-D-alanine ligase